MACLEHCHKGRIIDPNGRRFVTGQRFPQIMFAFEATVSVYIVFFAATGHARVHRHAVLASVALTGNVTKTQTNEG
jgi:hypothetical protein